MINIKGKTKLNFKINDFHKLHVCMHWPFVENQIDRKQLKDVFYVCSSAASANILKEH